MELVCEFRHKPFDSVTQKRQNFRKSDLHFITKTLLENA